MSIHHSLLDVQQYTGEGYRPIVDYGAWRVAILRYHPELEPDAISTMQRHDETDEVFVLLEGHCILFIGEGADGVTAVNAVDMEPKLAYNVKKGAWHTHTLSHDATVLIVENRDTQAANSPTIPLSAAHRARVRELTAQLWR
ncbi:MAG: hypothetical protein IPM16_00365 [Chloroflexi bacterium]|nr:hypothetical protein [Chloroflexota bacterium]